MATWCRNQDLTRTQRIDYAYDGRGELSAAITYASIAADGKGNPLNASATYYIYDTRGRLIQQIDPGADGGTTDYVYDGFGRVIATITPPLDGSVVRNLVITQYDDVGGMTERDLEAHSCTLRTHLNNALISQRVLIGCIIYLAA